MTHPKIHQIEKVKYLGTTSNGRAAAEGPCSCHAPPGWSTAAYLYIHKSDFAYPHVYMCIYIYIHIYILECVYIHIYIYMYAHIYIHVRIQIHVHVCIYFILKYLPACKLVH